MSAGLKKGILLLGLAALLAGLLLIKPEPIVNWLAWQNLQRETDPTKRIVLIHTALSYDAKYWNQRYLFSALRAGDPVEQSVIANIIFERFGTNGIPSLQAIARAAASEQERSNGLAVIARIGKSAQ